MGSVKNVQMPWMYPCIFMIFFALATAHSRKDFSLRKISRGLCALIPIPAILLIGFAMLLADTTRDLYYISGLQGRYYIPVMLIPVLCLMKSSPAGKTEQADQKTRLQMESDKDQKTERSWPVALLISYCMVHIVFLLNIVMVVLPVSVS